MRGDKKVIEQLNAALSAELTAIVQYMVQAEMCDSWGYHRLGGLTKARAIEEMHHAEGLIERIIFLDGFPNMQVLDPLHIGQNVKEVLDCDLKAEYSARSLYEKAATHCHSVKDYVTRDIFEGLMKDEESHIDFLETQIDLVKKIGIELYSQKHIGEFEHD